MYIKKPGYFNDMFKGKIVQKNFTRGGKILALHTIKSGRTNSYEHCIVAFEYRGAVLYASREFADHIPFNSTLIITEIESVIEDFNLILFSKPSIDDMINFIAVSLFKKGWDSPEKLPFAIGDQDINNHLFQFISRYKNGAGRHSSFLQVYKYCMAEFIDQMYLKGNNRK